MCHDNGKCVTRNVGGVPATNSCPDGQVTARTVRTGVGVTLTKCALVASIGSFSCMNS